MRKDPVQADLLEQVKKLSKEVATLLGKREGINDELKLIDQVKRLREEVETLKIEKARISESQDKREREVEHKVGLERKRQEFEREQSKREAVVAVREENLAADRGRFEEQMKFTTTRFETEVGYLKDLMGELLRRLPDISANFKTGGVDDGKE